jgi:hypothetical protein
MQSMHADAMHAWLISPQQSNHSFSKRTEQVARYRHKQHLLLISLGDTDDLPLPFTINILIFFFCLDYFVIIYDR